MNTVDIQQLQQIANQMTPEQAQQQLADIEAQQAQARQDAQTNFDYWQSLAADELNDYIAARQASDQEYIKTVTELARILETRLALENRFKGIKVRFEQWANYGLQNGLIKSTDGFNDQFSAQGIRDAEMRRLAGNRLQPIPPLGGLADWLIGITENFLSTHHIKS